MVENLLMVLKEYHDAKKCADNIFVNKICFIIMNYYQLDNYVKNLFIINNKNSCNCLYSFTTNTLIFNLDAMHNKQIQKILRDEYYGVYNLMVLKIILHEFEHVRQEKIRNSNDNTIERKILLLSDPYSYIKIPYNYISQLKSKYQWYRHRLYYNHNYLKVPYERMAIIKSCVKMDNISHNEFITNSYYFDAFDMINAAELKQILTNGYHLIKDKTSSPTLEYLHNLTKENHDIIMNDKSLYDFYIPSYERLLYGLSLTKEELNNIDDIKHTLIKKYGNEHEI